MNDLLKLLGKRVQELRTAKGWSQEEFAHVCGLHRTYIGQVERAEKNVSFENLTRISSALGITLGELLSGLEGGDAFNGKRGRFRAAPRGDIRMLEIQRLIRRLSNQQAAVQRTMGELMETIGALPAGAQQSPSPKRKKS